MPTNTLDRRVYDLLSRILGYPGPELGRGVEACIGLLQPANPEAAASLARFGTFVDETPLGRLEEIYTSTFDLGAVCCPYVGYQVFGNSYKRGFFLSQLNEEYRRRGFTVEAELAHELSDHLAVLLRFLQTLEDEEEAGELIADCLRPSLGKMDAALAAKGNPYRDVLQAILRVLEG